MWANATRRGAGVGTLELACSFFVVNATAITLALILNINFTHKTHNTSFFIICVHLMQALAVTKLTKIHKKCSNNDQIKRKTRTTKIILFTLRRPFCCELFGIHLVMIATGRQHIDIASYFEQS